MAIRRVLKDMLIVVDNILVKEREKSQKQQRRREMGWYRYDSSEGDERRPTTSLQHAQHRQPRRTRTANCVKFDSIGAFIAGVLLRCFHFCFPRRIFLAVWF